MDDANLSAALLDVPQPYDVPHIDQDKMFEIARRYLTGENPSALLRELGLADGVDRANRDNRFFRSRGFLFAVNTIRNDVEEYCSTHLGALSMRIIEEISDRIENGDEFIWVDKLGEEHRTTKKIKGKELAGILDIVYKTKSDLKDRLTGMNPGTREDKVRKLADQLERYIQAKEVEGEANRV